MTSPSAVLLKPPTTAALKTVVPRHNDTSPKAMLKRSVIEVVTAQPLIGGIVETIDGDGDKNLRHATQCQCCQQRWRWYRKPSTHRTISCRQHCRKSVGSQVKNRCLAEQRLTTKWLAIGDDLKNKQLTARSHGINARQNCYLWTLGYFIEILKYSQTAQDFHYFSGMYNVSFNLRVNMCNPAELSFRPTNYENNLSLVMVRVRLNNKTNYGASLF